MPKTAVDTQDKYLVPGLERGLRVLCEVGKNRGWLDAPELARRLDVPRTTVFRLLSTLEQMGFVSRDPGTGHKFGLGMSGLQLGFHYLSSLELTELGRPILESLRDQWGHSCHLVVRDATDVVYVAKAASLSPLASSVKVGTRLPAHATVFGRVLLQDFDLAGLRELYPDPELEARTPWTPTTVEQLHGLLVTDRAREWVQHRGFFEPSIATIAVPVRDGNGAIVAGLGLTVPDVDGTVPPAAPLAASVMAAAHALSRALKQRANATSIHSSSNGMTAT